MDYHYFDTKEIAKLAQEHYGIQCRVEPLNGYDEANYLLTAADGKNYILKVANDTHGIHFLEAQVQALKHLSKSVVASEFQQCVQNRLGFPITQIVKDDVNYYIRILTYLEGTFWVDCEVKSNELLFDLGTFLGKMDSALSNYTHPAVHRDYSWDISHAADAMENLRFIQDHEKRRIAHYFLQQFGMVAFQVLNKLPKYCIHNDANDYNLLVDNNRICGLIDFGDMVYSHRINNLAIACTYAMLGADDPLATAALVVKGYNNQLPLSTDELTILYYLIAARLCISVTNSAYQHSITSYNEHHFITEKPAWELIFKWLRVSPVKAELAFAESCNVQHETDIEKKRADLENDRLQFVGRNLSIGYDKHLKIVKGAFQYLYDDCGNTFIDCVNNVSHIGHCHPVVVEAMQQQVATLNTNTRYLHDGIVEYAKRLLKTLPSNLKVCYFTNSGSEANDLAIRISRHFTKQQDVIVLDHAYHGTSTVAMELSPYKFDSPGGSGQKPYIHKLLNPDLYRGPYKYNDPDAGKKYAADADRVIGLLAKDNKKPAAFICESLLGVGGQIPLPQGYLKEAYRIVREAGGICIADEVQVGFGRVGDKFWGFELQDVEPDMVVLGKPMGNGHPLAAVIMTEELADAFNNGMEYFNTFGGNPVSMATGVAVLDVIEQEELQQHALEVGDYLQQSLKSLMNKYPVIGDVRGHGLFVGAELVRSRETLEPLTPEIDQVVEMMKDKGFLLSTDGPLHNVLKIKPPLPFNKANADEFVVALDQTLSFLLS